MSVSITSHHSCPRQPLAISGSARQADALSTGKSLEAVLRAEHIERQARFKTLAEASQREIKSQRVKALLAAVPTLQYEPVFMTNEKWRPYPEFVGPCESPQRAIQRSYPIRVEEIQKAVCEHFGVTRCDMLSGRRHKRTVIPRQVAMYLCRAMTLRSLPDIGVRFGGRDHSTILYGTRKIAAQMGEEPYEGFVLDPELRDTVQAIRAKIEASKCA